MGFIKVLRLRHLAVLWLSQVLSAIGDFFYLIAVMWIAVKVAGSEAGIVAAAEAGAMLVFGLLGGVYADRWNRRTTMITVDILRAAAVMTLPILSQAGVLQLWHLVVVAIVVGSLGALFDPALQASLPALAGDTQTLQAANGLMDVTRRLARALGPSLAGLLIVVLPLVHFFTLDAISFLISAGAVFSLGRRFAWKPVQQEEDITRGLEGILSEIAGAIKLVRAHRPLAWAMVTMGLVTLAWAARCPTTGSPRTPRRCRCLRPHRRCLWSRQCPKQPGDRQPYHQTQSSNVIPGKGDYWRWFSHSSLCKHFAYSTARFCLCRHRRPNGGHCAADHDTN